MTIPDTAVRLIVLLAILLAVSGLVIAGLVRQNRQLQHDIRMRQVIGRPPEERR